MKIVFVVVSAIVFLIALAYFIGAMLPTKHTVTRTARIARPPAEVYATLAGSPDWHPGIVRWETLPPRDGHRTWKEYDARGRAVTYEEVRSDPPREFVTRIADKSLPFGGTWTHEVRGSGTGSEVTITEDGEIYSPLFRFVSKFIMGHASTVEKYLKALEARLQ